MCSSESFRQCNSFQPLLNRPANNSNSGTSKFLGVRSEVRLMQSFRRMRATALLASSLAALTFLGASFLAASSRADDIPATASGDLHVPPVKIIDTKLSNGLRVLIVADHSAPVYAIDVCYNVGSRNERPGRTGFAHLFENLMFEGSKNGGR